MIPAMTPITIPAMAPPLRPPPAALDSTSVPFTPVGIGVVKGTVAVAEPVAVMTITPLLVGRTGADGFEPVMEPPRDPPADPPPMPLQMLLDASAHHCPPLQHAVPHISAELHADPVGLPPT